MLMTSVANLPLESTTPAVAKFTAGVVDTGALTCEYLREFSKKIRFDPYFIFRSLGVP
jgi:hypothetical protein